MLRLIELNTGWVERYRAFVEEFLAAGEGDDLMSLLGEPTLPDLLRRLEGFARGENLPRGWVPATTYWLVDAAGTILGELRFRRLLTKGLEDVGGHVGYRVRPGQRCRGLATTMLRRAIEEARRAGLARILVTCDAENLASARVIEKCGGELASRSIAHNGRLTSRYWIPLAQDAGRAFPAARVR